MTFLLVVCVIVVADGPLTVAAFGGITGACAGAAFAAFFGWFAVGLWKQRRRLMRAWQRGELHELVPVFDRWAGPGAFLYNYDVAGLHGYFVSLRELTAGAKVPALVDAESVIIFPPRQRPAIFKRADGVPRATAR